MSCTQTWQAVKKQVRAGLMVRTHSGLIQPGEVFVALPGSRTSGMEYIAEALSRKAGVVVVGSGLGAPIVQDATILEHPQPQEALGELAAAYFGTEEGCPLLVGVTGTNGKTTVVHLLGHLLGCAGIRVGTIGTIGAKWPGGSHDSGMTTPDCWTLHGILAQMRTSGVTHVCMEVSSHALAQRRTAGLRFETAVLTNVTQDHLDYHPTLEDYFQAKALLFAPGPQEPRRRVINADCEHGRRLLSQWGGMGYTLRNAPEHRQDWLLGEVRSCDRQGLQLHITHNDLVWDMHSDLVGRHNAANLMAAQGVGLCLGLGPEAMQSLADFPGVPGRLERIANAFDLDIFVDYAHTPDALDNVLGALRALNFKRLIVVFGCGGDRDRTKRPLMGQAVCRWADVAVLTSDNPRSEDPEAIMDDVRPGLSGCVQVFPEVNRKRAIQLAVDLMHPGDALLVAGKGHEATQQIKDQSIPFHDPTIIREILGEVHECS